MEWIILFMGPVGSGKTQAIQSISDIEVLSTDVMPTDAVSRVKSGTTVSMDVGVLNLPGNDRLRLHGAPGQKRFEFMWDILLPKANGVVLLINHASADPLADLDDYLHVICQRVPAHRLSLTIGVTHVDKNPAVPLSIYSDHLRQRGVLFCGVMPHVLEVDARLRSHVRYLLLIMVAHMEMALRFPVVSAKVAVAAL